MSNFLVDDKEDIDYMFEEINQDGLELQDCIVHVKKLYDEAAKGTQAKKFYYTMWSTLRSQSLVLNEMNRAHKSNQYLYRRIRIQDGIICNLLDKDAKIDQPNLVDKIIDMLKPQQKTAKLNE